MSGDNDYIIAIHIGAGYHSPTKEKLYKILSKKACLEASHLLKGGCSATSAVATAIRYLENSSLTNAGFGSNLTEDGTVECDASLMDGQTKNYGSVASLSGIRNPILVAKELITSQSEIPLPLGRTPPCFLAGYGAQRWAKLKGFTVVDSKELISDSAWKDFIETKRMYEEVTSSENIKTNLRIIKDIPSNSCSSNSYKRRKMTPTITDSESNDMSILLDTVGAVCVDTHGRVAAGVSSGGIKFKVPGRVGQAASFGCGCWAEETPNYSIATSTTGNGELLIKSMLCKNISCESLQNDDLTSVIINEIKQNVINLNCLDCTKMVGVLLARKCSNSEVELQWAHTTASMCIGYYTPSLKKVKTIITRIPQNSTGKQINVQGCKFKL